MYRSVHIQNFRGLRDLTIADLGRVNLIAGPNNADKTSLLEALWLLEGQATANMTTALALLRGFELPLQTPELLWHSLFYQRNVALPVRIEGVEGDDKGRVLELTATVASAQPILTSAEGLLSGFASPGLEEGLLAPEALQYHYHLADGTDVVRRVWASEGREEASASKAEVKARSSSFLTTRRWLPTTALATAFTRAADDEQLALLERSARQLEPALHSFSLGYVEGRPLIRAPLGEDRPLPLHLLGGGVVRLAEILLTAYSCANGLELIDEIEDGFHHSALETVWRALDEASVAANVQVFATTHSYECVEAAAKAFAGNNARDLRLHRLERDEDQINVTTYTHETAKSAVDYGFEVR